MQLLTGARQAFAVAAIACAVWTVQPIASGQNDNSPVPARPDDRVIAHVLNRIGFGPRPGDLERVRRLGLSAYIEQQLRPGTIEDAGMAARLAGLGTLTKSTRELADSYFIPAQMARREQQRQQAQGSSATNPEAARPRMDPSGMDAVRSERTVMLELSEQKILRAIYSERQLQEVMVDFWFNHFNVFAGKGPTRLYLMEYERDVIRPHALGTFRDLLQATAESPAMLFYLDNWQSAAPPGAQTMDAIPGPRTRQARRRPGLAPPRAPGAAPQAATTRRPRGLNENYARELMELHTLGVDGGYTQKDVQEVARAFTGWTIANPRQGGGFFFNPRMHDAGGKVVLGQRTGAGGAKSDGERVLDILAAHPSTARHLATKLARRFVADDPPAALVERAARRFRETGGDIREVVRTIVISPEFFAPAAYRVKTKTPFEFVVSAVRATSLDAVEARPLVQALRALGMPLYMCQPPTGYADRSEAWVNAGALLNRMNFALAVTRRTGNARVPGARAAPAPIASGEAMVRSVMAGDVSETTAATVARATTPAQGAALVLGSPDFQKR